MSSPPFGSSEFLLRTLPELKQGYKRLEMLSLCPVYSNPYSNASAALQPIDQWNKAPVAMQNRNLAAAPKVTHLCAVHGSNTRSPFSLECACEEDR
jgi:hypothetical protein